MLARWTWMAAVCVVSAYGTSTWACGGYGSAEQAMPPLLESFEKLIKVEAPTATQREELEFLCGEMRRYGYAGLDRVLELRDKTDSRSPAPSINGSIARPRTDVDPWIDRIAGQRFAAHSRLFWHTSRAAAQREAERTGRPVLSLRMLGRLDEDLSCANSRFFRTILYPDPEIRRLLRTHFVLHWQPVRDVPVVTVDFGDGKLLRQPLVGNSVHLLVSPEGHVLDAMPGLVTPETFSQWLGEATTLWDEINGLAPEHRGRKLATWHAKRAQQRRQTSHLAVTRQQNISDLNPLDPRWQEAAGGVQVKLSAVTQELVNLQQPEANAAMRIAPLKSFVEAPLLRMVQVIEPRLAIDDVFNRYALQTKLDDWYQVDDKPFDYDEMTQQIYEHLFLMPLDDPWLGLSTTDRFAGLEGGGRIETPALPLATSVRSAGKR